MNTHVDATPQCISHEETMTGIKPKPSKAMVGAIVNGPIKRMRKPMTPVAPMIT